MKRLLAVFTLLAVLFTFTACKKENTPVVESTGSLTQDSTTIETSDTKTTQTEQNTEWGVKQNFSIMTADYKVTNFSMRTNTLGQMGSELNCYLISDSSTVTLVGNHVFDLGVSPATVADILPDYESELSKSLTSYYGDSKKNNFSISISSTELCTIDGKEMCKYIGILSYVDDPLLSHTNKSAQFVAYSTRLPVSGLEIYWLIADTSEDQSNGAAIAEDAYKMAFTIVEQ